MKRFLTVAAAMLALTGMGQVAMRKLEDLTNTNLVCVTDYGPQLVSVTGGLASISGAVAVHTNRTDNPHGVTAAQVGALTAEADPVAGPRLDLIEPETNKWNAAYGWGDHALAGYLLPADLAPYATTQQVEVAAAALAVHTNRTDNPHGVTAAQIGALTAEQDLVALAADRFLPIDAGKNVISTDAGANANTTQSILIGDRAGNVVTGATIIAIGRDAAREIVPLAGIMPGTELSTIAIGENAAEQAGGIWAFTHNIAIGNSAFKEGKGQSSIAIGQDALDKSLGAFTSIAIGREAGRTAAAEHMIAIGYQAGEQAGLTNSVVIGANAGRRASGQNLLVIDSSGNDDSDYPARAMIYGNVNDLTLGRIDSNNNVLRGNWLFNNNQILTNEQDLAALRTYHYGSPDIVESPAEWFVFDGAGTITEFNWEAGRTNVVIPWAIGGVPVTAIGASAFRESGIVSLIAPQTVTMIGSTAFNYCTSLASVSLPQATAIGNYAFSGCTSLASVSLPQATAIGNYAFSGCTSLASVSLPQATSIGDYAFDYCIELASVTIPQVTAIGAKAFYNCGSLTAVRMGRNAPAEATEVFYGITSPPTVYVTNPQATGWGDTWNGALVVRPPLYADAIYQAGELVATTGHVAQAIAAIPEPDLSGKADVQDGVATNLSTHGWLALPQTQATNLTYRLVTSNDVILAIGVWE